LEGPAEQLVHRGARKSASINRGGGRVVAPTLRVRRRKLLLPWQALVIRIFLTPSAPGNWYRRDRRSHLSFPTAWSAPPKNSMSWYPDSRHARVRAAAPQRSSAHRQQLLAKRDVMEGGIPFLVDDLIESAVRATFLLGPF